jgi:hypothetical protein
MKFNNLTLGIFASMSIFAIAAEANEVKLVVNKPMAVTYRLAYQDRGKEPVLGERTSIQVNDNYAIPVDLSNHKTVGVVIESVAGRTLPATANQFNQPKQCSLATDSRKTSGNLILSADKKTINCRREEI